MATSVFAHETEHGTYRVEEWADRPDHDIDVIVSYRPRAGEKRFTAYRWHADGSWSHLDAGWKHLHTARAEVTQAPAGAPLDRPELIALLGHALPTAVAS